MLMIAEIGYGGEMLTWMATAIFENEDDY